jgi:hypothetical protein
MKSRGGGWSAAMAHKIQTIQSPISRAEIDDVQSMLSDIKRKLKDFETDETSANPLQRNRRIALRNVDALLQAVSRNRDRLDRALEMQHRFQNKK